MKKNWKYIVLLLMAAGTVVILAKHRPYRHESGLIFGTLYNITYQSDEELHDAIEAELRRVDASLSPFNDTSVISRVNRSEPVRTDSLFGHVFRLAQEISGETGGAFDITVAPLVNAWGFGFKKAQDVDSATIDSLMQFVGYRRVALVGGDSVAKEDERLMLDCSAIAKGYGSDVVARFLESRGIKNYMVEIGGEIVVRGKNPQGDDWRIGIVRPTDDSLARQSEWQAIFSGSNLGMATSGNYRNYYVKEGKKYAHTIDPATGYPVQHSLLSATVLANSCARADALATAFMVMGVERAMQYCATHPSIEAYFIYSDSTGNYQTCVSPGCTRFKNLH